MKRRPNFCSSRVGIPSLVVAMVALASVLFIAVDGRPALTPDHVWLTWWMLVPAFALAEIFVVHLATSSGAHTHSLREVPNVMGLAFLSPVAYLAAHLLGTGAALLFHRRQRGVKLAFNLALFTIEALGGVLVYRLVLGAAAPSDPHGWAAAMAATLSTDLLSAFLITAVIGLHERGVDWSVVAQTVTRGALAAAANTCLAALVVVLVTFEPAALPLLMVVLLVLYLTYFAYVSLWVGHTRVRLLYRFMQKAGSLGGVAEVADVVLRQAREIMQASTAELIMLPAPDQPGTRLTMSDDRGDAQERPILQLDGAEWWHEAMSGCSVSTATTSCTEHGSGCRGGVAAPIRSGAAAVIGVMLVHDRTVEVDPFSREDEDLFATVAAHASVALDNAKMLDRLRRDAKEREHQALHDSLTGLPNRLSMMRQLESAVEGGTAAVVLLGIDDVERVTEVLGHAAGEALLRLVADRLRDADVGVVCRLEGSQFAVVIVGREVADARRVGEDLLSALRRPLLLKDVPLYVTGRAGIACAPLDGSEPTTLLSYAFASMHSAEPGEVTFAHRAERGAQDAELRLKLAADLSEALGTGGLDVWYQPQVVAGTEVLHGVEALLRWQHPTYSWVPPNQIIDVAERTGQLLRLTEYVLDRALAQRRVWLEQGIDIRMSVNVPAQILHDETLTDRVTRRLWETHTSPGSLVLEVTESGVMADPDRCLRGLLDLAAAGVEISIDDFGTGYSSLAYLDRLPLQEVKIDRSFVQALNEGRHDGAVLRSTIALAHEIGLRVVAEGVETLSAATRLTNLGCDLIQGYVTGRPMPAEKLEQWLASRGRDHVEPTSERSGPVAAERSNLTDLRAHRTFDRR